ncbi:MAG TPA: hypothetical protein VE967_16495 [Gemmatimonadaceae bacterium]|nr:hypothetical protein [Gemmatimonadaceae bacterium]
MGANRRSFALNDSDAVLRQVLLELDDLRLSRHPAESQADGAVDEAEQWGEIRGGLRQRALV